MINNNKPTKLILHHSGVNTLFSHFPGIERVHKERNFPKSSLGFYCGYHKVINKQGGIITARGDKDRGAHTIGWNDRSIGICLEGNFDTKVPTEAQLNSLRVLIRDYDLDYLFHKDAQPNRTCAGRYFTDELIEEKAKAEPTADKNKRERLQRQLLNIQKIIWELKVKISWIARLRKFK